MYNNFKNVYVELNSQLINYYAARINVPCCSVNDLISRNLAYSNILFYQSKLKNLILTYFCHSGKPNRNQSKVIGAISLHYIHDNINIFDYGG